MQRAELIGQSFGRLVVREFYGVQHNHCMWLCECSCGGTTITSTNSLNGGHTRSCGCLMREVSRANRIAEATHGHTRHGRQSPTYSTWASMHERCRNPNHVAYHRYGLRGVTVCTRWAEFENFLADMGERPDGLTLDRRESSQGYSTDNCRWATPKQQMRNRSVQKLTYEKAEAIRVDARTQVVIALDYGISRSMVSAIKVGRTWQTEL